MTENKLRYLRIILKISGEMSQDNGKVISEKAIKVAVDEIKDAHDLGVQVAVVLGGGNIFRGRDLDGAEYIDKDTRDYMGMVATQINGLSLCDVLENYGHIPSRLMSALETKKIAEPYLKRRAIRHLEKGRVVIRVGGIGEPSFDTDAAAVLFASDIHAKAILKGTKVDGIFDRDPILDPKAEFFETISKKEYVKRELGVVAIKALLLNDNKIPFHVFNIFEKGTLKRLLLGENVGSEIIF